MFFLSWGKADKYLYTTSGQVKNETKIIYFHKKQQKNSKLQKTFALSIAIHVVIEKYTF